TMSFHGGDTARRVWGLPEIEKLFSATPDNFIVTFDAYLHDDLAAKPATADEAAQLKLFLTTLGNSARLYHKPIALWGGVNAWGLAQESSAPRGIPDASSNLLMLYDLPARMGGEVWGVFAWNYNVKQQGIENYNRPTTYDPRALEIAVERTFPILRARAVANKTSAPEIVILYSARAMYRTLGAARAFADRDAVLMSVELARTGASDAFYVIVAASPADLDAPDLDFLRAQFLEGRVLFGEPALARALGARAVVWQAASGQLPEQGGVIYQSVTYP